MKQLLKTVIIVIVFLFSNSQIYAFQKTTPKTIELPQELIVEKSKAELLLNEGLWDEAILRYKSLQQKYLALNFDQLAINLYEDLLLVIIIREDLGLEEKRSFIKEIKDKEVSPSFEGIYNGALAHLFTYYGEVDSIQKYYSKACLLYQKDNRFALEGNLNVTLAYEYYLSNDLQNAQSFLKKAEQILEKKLAPQNIDLVAIYNAQTLIYYSLGEYDKALKSNLISIRSLENAPFIDSLALAYEYNNLASIYLFIEDYNNSLDYYQKALNLVRLGDYPPSTFAIFIYNVGNVYSQQENIPLAKESFLEALSYLDQSNLKTTEIQNNYINNYHQLVYCYKEVQDLDSALYYVQKAENINKTYPYRISNTYKLLSQVFLAQAAYPKAEKYALKSIQETIRAYGTKSAVLSNCYNTLSQINEKQNKIEEALANIQKALEAISIDFSDIKGVSNPKLANVLNKGNLLVSLGRKLSLLKKLYQQESPLVTADNVFATAKLTAEALEQMNRKMQDIKSKRESLNRQALPLFETAISSALDVANKTGKKAYINEAFMLSERSKSMLMADAMQGAIASSLGGIPDSLLKQLDEMQEALADAEKQRFEAKAAGNKDLEKELKAVVFDSKHHLNLFEYNLESQYPKYKTLKMKSSVASVSDIQGVLSPNTTFIEYFEGENDIYAFAISKNEVSVEVIPKEADFKLNIFSFQKSLMNIKPFTKRPGLVYNAFIKKSHYFYQKLVEQAIKGHKTERLIIVPDGQLGYLPFEVLLNKPMPLLKQGTDEGANFAKLPYLLRDYKISYNYSGTLLMAQQAKKESIINGNILALAPSYASAATPTWRKKREVDLRKTLIELPGAIDEVAKLEELYTGQFYTGQQANERVFKDCAPKHGILHLAMHGLVDQKDPEYSGLALTEDQSKSEDNFLYAYEIKQLGLQAGLVVLSACETGVGKYQRGEGVVSIGRGFMYAGAPALLMTLWSLNDQSGAVIIDHFYKNLSEGMEKDEAIRQAKLFYIDHYPSEYTHPFMWAAFVQVGDYSSIEVNRRTSWMYYIIGACVVLLGLLLFLFKKRKKA
ncbi:MAG: Unknown protein [uncultured Aureispira sp.]|uniref:CHAT domain-containing protein n=1 Tax=uncultured Aureispira sp. TaxID=1331704 RepID=A0A6S6UEV1_9BACT|nr:MAG: Unknown protein [uncultured Aureispira sp.]